MKMKVSGRTVFYHGKGLLKTRFLNIFPAEKNSRSFIYPSLENNECKIQENVCFKIRGSHCNLTKAPRFRYFYLFSKTLLRFWQFMSPRE